MTLKTASLLLLFALLMTACGTTTRNEPASILPVEEHAVRPTPAATQEVPIAPSATPIETNPAAQAARRDLADALRVDLQTVETRLVEAAEWPDGCLGLAKPDEMCTLATVPGYRVTLAVKGVEYVYRTDERGTALRREWGAVFDVPAAPGRFLAAWQNADCTSQALLLPEGLSFGPCNGPHMLLTWQDGQIPPEMAGWLARLAPFQSETPAGRVVFDGIGTETAAPAEQRAIAGWFHIRFLAAQSGRPNADWGLVLTYSQQGGLAGFCDTLQVYLDGSARLSSCKDVDVDVRLDATQLERLYQWYDSLEPIDYFYEDPATADALSITLTLPGQGARAADPATVEEILAFCAALLQQGRTQP